MTKVEIQNKETLPRAIIDAEPSSECVSHEACRSSIKSLDIHTEKIEIKNHRGVPTPLLVLLREWEIRYNHGQHIRNRSWSRSTGRC